MDRRKIPAYGEIRAIGGYGKQYLLIAQIIYKYLNEGNITWLKFVDVNAGALDDFQICRGNRIDAYQIKSSQYEQNTTYNDIFVTETKGKTLFSVCQLTINC